MTKSTQETCLAMLARAKESARVLRNQSAEKINLVLRQVAEALLDNCNEILQANQQDLSLMDQNDPRYDRLLLHQERVAGLADSLKKIAAFDSIIGQSIKETVLTNGLVARQERVPLGIVGMIYEARPNVTVDAFAICFKTANVACLKGGSDANHTNRSLVKIIHSVLEKQDLPVELLTLLPAEREAVKYLLEADQYVDVIIPRGSRGLIDYVRENAKLPVIETGAGVVHIYLDDEADLEIARPIIYSAKLRRPSVCNALDCLVVHKEIVNQLAELLGGLAEKNVKIYADTASYQVLKDHYPKDLLNEAEDKDFGKEFLGLELSIKAVDGIDQAINHIRKYSSGHSEAIISKSQAKADQFKNNLDSACIFWNTETGFADGEQLGLGAEIGISTQMLHARGPMGLEAMTTYQWVIKGNGQVRQ